MPVQNPCELLRRLLAEGRETPWLEFKHNCVQVREVGHYVSALANSAVLADKDRAYIVYGIEDQTLRRIGTSFRPSTAKIGNDRLRNWLSHRVEPSLHIEFHEFDCEGLSFAIIEIEPSYHRPVKCEGEAYIRIGEHQKKLADHPEYERSVWLATSRRKFENAIALPNVRADELEQVLEWNQFYRFTGQPTPAQPRLILKEFTDRKFIADEMDGTYAVTNLGALLWARDIRTFPTVARKTVRVVRYIGTDIRNAESEREGQRGYALGFAGLIDFIGTKTNRREAIAGGVRRDIPIIPELAIRELTANALIHQDLGVQGGGPIIEIFDDRIDISNPGASLGEISRLIDGAPRSRNEMLARAMRDLGFCEERGKGLDKSIFAIEELAINDRIHLPAPSFRTESGSFTATLYGPKPFNKLSREERLRSCYQHCVLAYLKGDYMSNSSLRERFSLDDDDYKAASKVITDATRSDIIAPADDKQGKRNARYIPSWAK